METIKLKYQDIIIVDPCYIKNVYTRWGDKKEQRFDALKLLRVVHDGDDGAFPVTLKSGTKWLGVDSGRIWAMQAEFEVELEVDCGLSGCLVIKKDSIDWRGETGGSDV